MNFMKLFFDLTQGRLVSPRKEADSVKASVESANYRVRWQARDGSIHGHGDAIFTKSQAERIAARMNAECPRIQHWASH